MATYKWKASADFRSDTTMSYGVTPNTYQNWQTASTGPMSPGTFTYWYRDSNYGPGGAYTDDNSSRVAISVTESWSATVDDLNNLTVSVTTTLNSVVRDDLRGENRDAPARDINIYQEQGGGAVLSLYDNQLASAHTIWPGPMTLSVHSFTLPPGQSASRSTLYIHNQTSGAASYDDIWAGIHFLNDLPAPTTYRVTYDANGGTGAPSQQSHTTAQSSWTFSVASGTPSWGLYEFLGWSRTRYTDSRTEDDVEFVAGDPITLTQGNPTVTLYAVWRMDYRPGSVLSGNEWLSHNREGGKCHVLAGSMWQECRTIGAPTAMGNPPSVYHNNKWYNMSRIGKGR